MDAQQVAQPVARRRMGVRALLQDERGIAYIFVAPSLILIAASTLSLGDLGEPEPDRRGGVLRTLERRSEEVAT